VNNDSAARIADDVSKAARKTAREWAGVIDAEDAEQEIWLRVLEAGKDYADQLADMDEAARTSVLNTIGQQVASRYRNEYEGFSGNYIYGTEEVRDLLKGGALLAEDGGQHLVTSDDVNGVDEDGLDVRQQSARRERETVTERVDLRLGMASLAKRNSNYFSAIIRAYKLGIAPVGDTEPKNLTRAVDALTNEMNWSFKRRYDEFEGPGKR
jgi:DNA-directed RNA polymerase specialized sigma24 family protein